MPALHLISDPGFRLVRACHQAGIKVSLVVGASAAIAALSVAGLPSDKFYFYGFACQNRRTTKELTKIKDLTATLIFESAPSYC